MLTVKEFEDQVKTSLPGAVHCRTECDFLFFSPGLVVKYTTQAVPYPWKVECKGRGITIGKTLEQAIQSLPSNPN